jgi:peptidoglycan/xylan/chitin deacetylase (PgdA/CDA1 family)
MGPTALVLLIILLISGWIFGTILYNAACNPRSSLFGPIIWHSPTSEKVIALTFDDGPNPPYTQEILKILEEYSIKATFFLWGQNVREYPEVAREIASAGHAIGNHTYSHPPLIIIRRSLSQIESEIVQAENIIFHTTGVRPTIFRPPSGLRGPLLFRVTRKRGYTVIQWSVDAKDWEKPGADIIVKRVLAGTEPGAIILLHDGSGIMENDSSQTVAALPVIIEELLSRGYYFVTIPELIAGKRGSTGDQDT